MPDTRADVTLNRKPCGQTRLVDLIGSGPRYFETLDDNRVGIIYKHHNKKIVRYLDDLRCTYLEETERVANKPARALDPGEVVNVVVRINR